MKNEEDLIQKEEKKENEIPEEKIRKKLGNQLYKEIIENNEEIYSEYLDLNDNSKPKYRFNCSEIIKKARDHSDDKNFYNEIEFDCNLCNNFSKIDKALKIDSFSLISFIHHNNHDYNYLFYLNNKIYNYMKQFQLVESYIYIRILYRSPSLLLL